LNHQAGFAENLKPTAILDWDAPSIRALATDLVQREEGDREIIRAAHHHLAQSVRPIYTLDELQPASVTLSKQSGSCSQRMACLEAIARAAGIPTRVHAQSSGTRVFAFLACSCRRESCSSGHNFSSRTDGLTQAKFTNRLFNWQIMRLTRSTTTVNRSSMLLSTLRLICSQIPA
jgi:hypothetical protein